MLKTSLVILYAAPLALAFFWSYQYFAMASVNALHKEAEQALRKKNAAFGETLAKLKPAAEELVPLEKKYYDYRKVAAVSQTSWSDLLNRLEKLTPDNLRFKRISIRPEKLVKVNLEGEASDLSHITSLLQALFNETVFMNPNLRQHRRIQNEGKDSVSFNLEVDFAGESGELP